MHNSMPLPDDPMIPFGVQVVDHLADSSTLTQLAETRDGLTWSVQNGAPIALTAVEAAHELPSPALLALCIAFGIYVPLDVVRSDPLGVIGELSKALVAPEVIPPRIARHRA